MVIKSHTATLPPQAWLDGTAYLAPQLAFNLGVPYHLAPFLSFRSGSGLGSADPCGSGEASSSRDAVVIERLQLPTPPLGPTSARGRAAERPRCGSVQQPRMASMVTVACVSEPDTSALQRGGGARRGDGSLGKPGDDPEAGPDLTEQTGPAEDAGSAEAAGEQVVAALRRHFLNAPRSEAALGFAAALPWPMALGLLMAMVVSPCLHDSYLCSLRLHIYVIPF